MYYFIINNTGTYRSILRSSASNNLTAGSGEQAYSEDNFDAYYNPEDYRYGSVETSFVLKTAISSVDSDRTNVVTIMAMEMDVYQAIKSSTSNGREAILLSGLNGSADKFNFIMPLPPTYSSGCKVRFQCATYNTTQNVRLEVTNAIALATYNEQDVPIVFQGSGVDLVEFWTGWVEMSDTNLAALQDLSFSINRPADHSNDEYTGSLWVTKAEVKYNY